MSKVLTNVRLTPEARAVLDAECLKRGLSPGIFLDQLLKGFIPWTPQIIDPRADRQAQREAERADRQAQREAARAAKSPRRPTPGEISARKKVRIEKFMQLKNTLDADPTLVGGMAMRIDDMTDAEFSALQARRREWLVECRNILATHIEPMTRERLIDKAWSTGSVPDPIQIEIDVKEYMDKQYAMYSD